MSAPVIDLRGLSRTFPGTPPVEALRRVDLVVERGEYVSVVGPSGSGKSTLLHILGLLDRPTSGHYYLRGQDVAQLSDDALSGLRNQAIGFVFQSFYLIPYATALDNVLLPGLYSAKPQAELRERAEFLL